jgi:hypothetical protein
MKQKFDFIKTVGFRLSKLIKCPKIATSDKLLAPETQVIAITSHK